MTYRVKLHNTITDQRYEFIAADQAEIDARLARKVGVYGAENEREVEIIDTAPEEAAARIAAAWATADAAAEAGADQNARARYLAWLIDPACPQARKDKIVAVQAWMDAIWMTYAAYKANPTGEFTLPTDPCPHTFWDIAS